jgi:hypothetical protein
MTFGADRLFIYWFIGAFSLDTAVVGACAAAVLAEVAEDVARSHRSEC